VSHTDIRPDIVSRLPVWCRPYALLSRWDRPIGTWLLLLPCWWALCLAPGIPSLWLVGLFGIGSVIMRGAGCTLNDILDRNLDAKVERTRGRPLPSGAVTLFEAVLWLALQLLAGLGILLLLPPLAVWLGVASLLLVGTYPLMKRITWWPQLFLGLTFNCGIPLGWAAATGNLAPQVLWLYGGAIAWTIVYDTIYAHQDKQDDALVGVKSTARLFGSRSRPILALFAVLAMLLFAGAGWQGGLGKGYFWGLGAAALHLAWQLLAWLPDDPADSLQKFRSNRDFGFIILGAILLGKMT
jgi:4-hydroxybenzoate polyprenyltransferase